jgi:phosphate transport system permease protein
VGLTTPRTTGVAAARSMTAGLTKKGIDVRGKLVEAGLVAALGLALLILAVLIVDLVRRSWPIWTDRPGEFLTTGLNSANAAQAGVWSGIKGTIILAVIVAIVAFPLGIACAVYLEEYAGRSRFARWTRINVRNLAGVPSIVRRSSTACSVSPSS